MTDKIINRISPCLCGCGGKDSQHAQRFHRDVKNVSFPTEPAAVETRAFGTETACAFGEAKINGRVEKVAFVFLGPVAPEREEEWARNFRPLGWCRIYQ